MSLFFWFVQCVFCGQIGYVFKFNSFYCQLLILLQSRAFWLGRGNLVLFFLSNCRPFAPIFLWQSPAPYCYLFIRNYPYCNPLLVKHIYCYFFIALPKIATSSLKKHIYCCFFMNRLAQNCYLFIKKHLVAGRAAVPLPLLTLTHLRYPQHPTSRHRVRVRPTYRRREPS